MPSIAEQLTKMGAGIMGAMFFMGIAVGWWLGVNSAVKPKPWEGDVDSIAKSMDKIIKDPSRKQELCRGIATALDRLDRSDDVPPRLLEFLRRKHAELCG